MPLYINPDFRRLPSGVAGAFRGDPESFFQLPAWYDLVARHGVPSGAEIRVYTDERPGSATAVVLQAPKPGYARRLESLTNAHSLEHGLLCRSATDLQNSLPAILSEIFGERPHWDCLTLSELDPADPSFAVLTGALRRAGLLVERTLSSGTWYEETDGLSFTEYLAARPAELRNTWRRKRRKLHETKGLAKRFFADDDKNIDQAIADYQTVYEASWKPPESFPAFVPELIRLAARLRALRLGIYYLDGAPAAAQFWIVWRGRAYICKLAHDERFDALSLGTILTMDMFERVLGEDRPREISLGRGDDPYKRMWLPKRRERCGIMASNPRTLHGLRLGLRGRAARIYHRLQRAGGARLV
ncbi:MAG: GNAT family N-acetyltransferase [Alphaproteobacteria bacterium]|nr:GNAT family N-acetyltransferase [Alphaproteobacteria bacterium]